MFFAVLVIVVCSCSALMTRSFVQRRRHRHLIEEAIRNGTWIPPNGGLNVGVGRGPHGWNIDMSKKPEIWEMFIKGQNAIESSGPGHVDAEWDWDSIKPLSATTGKSPSSQRISLYNSVGLDSATRTNNTTSLPADRRSHTLRYLGMANPSPPLPESNTLTKSSASLPKPKSITVATLITMPSQDRSSRTFSQFHQPAPSLFPPKSHFVSSPSLNSSPSVIPVTSLMRAMPSSSLFPQQAKPHPEAKAKGLPHIEFGIVELPLRDRGLKEDG